MLGNIGKVLSIAVLGISLAAAAPVNAQTAGPDGLVKVKSAYGMEETITRLKADIAAKGIMFFSAIDQSQLAAGAGIQLRPSTLLIFGNPPLGTQFMTSNPYSGLDWPVRLLVIQDEKGGSVDRLHGFRLDSSAARHFRSHAAVRHGFRGDRFDHCERQGAVS